MRKLWPFFFVLFPSFVSAGVHVQQNDPSLTIGSMTVTTGGILTTSITITSPNEDINDSQGFNWIYNTGNRTNFFAGSGAGVVNGPGIGTNNTGIGGNALGSMTTANQCTALGEEAGSNLNTGTGIILVGYGDQANNGLTNAIVIGNQASVTSSNTAVIGGPPNSASSMILVVSSIATSQIQWADGSKSTSSSSGSGSNTALGSTQTWTGQNNWVTPAPSTFTYQLVAGSITVNGPGDGNITETIMQSTYGVISSSFQITSGHLLCSNSTSYTTGDCGTAVISGGNPYDIQYTSANGTQFTGSDNFQNNGSTITMSGIYVISEINVSTQSATGVYFNYSGSTMTISSLTVTNPLPRTAVSGGVVYSSSFSFVNASSATGVTSYVNSNLSAVITPASTSSRIKITLSGTLAASGAVSAECDVNISTGGVPIVGLAKNPLAAATDVAVGVTGVGSGNFSWIDSPNTISAVTYTVVMKGAGTTPTCTFNSGSAAGTATLFVEDIGPQ